jgi:hypothetical protein
VRASEKSAEAIVVMIAGETRKERRAEGGSTAQGGLPPKASKRSGTEGRDNCGRYPEGRKEPIGEAEQAPRAGAESEVERRPERKQCTRI